MLLLYRCYTAYERLHHHLFLEQTHSTAAAKDIRQFLQMFQCSIQWTERPKIALNIALLNIVCAENRYWCNLYRDLSGLCDASVGLDVCDVYRSIVTASESTSSNADAKRVRSVLHIHAADMIA